jgi:uncharacterized protein
MPTGPALTVRCPACGRKAVYAPSNVWRPFCSERCRDQDLGAWASERFRIAAEQPDETDAPSQHPPTRDAD